MKIHSDIHSHTYTVLLASITDTHTNIYAILKESITVYPLKKMFRRS